MKAIVCTKYALKGVKSVFDVSSVVLIFYSIF